MVRRFSLVIVGCAVASVALAMTVVALATAQSAKPGKQAAAGSAPKLSAAGSNSTGSPAGELSLLDTSSPLKVEGQEGLDTAAAYLTLENPGKAPVHFQVRFLATSSEAVKLKEFTPQMVPPGEPQRVKLTFSGLKDLGESASGQVVVTGTAPTISQAVEVDPAPQPDASWPAVLILGSFVVALLLALAIVPCRPNLGVLQTPAPGPKLSYESWATSLTVAGGIAGTVLGGIVYPTFPAQISKQALLNLGILFAALVVLAPFVFEALRTISPDKKDKEKERFGTNFGLLVACTMTMWGVLGELGSFSLLAWELATTHVERTVMLAGVALIAVLAARYFLISVYYLVRKKWAEEEAAPGTTVTAPTAPPSSPLYVQRLLAGQEADFTEVDNLVFATDFATATVLTDPEQKTATIDIEPTAPSPPERWSLL
jgi:hypothetical protein